MRSNDLTPLLRATVGFDRMMNLLDSTSRLDEGALSYPPYNIEKIGEDDYRIVMAVAGFGEDELEITVKENSLVIAGKKGKALNSHKKAVKSNCLPASRFSAIAVSKPVTRYQFQPARSI